MIMMKKQCSKCKRMLDHSEFSKDKSRKDKLCCQCKECQSKYTKEKNIILKRESIIFFGGRCTHVDKNGVQCSKNYIDNLDELELSHPNGDGDEHRNLISNGRCGYRFYEALKKLGYDTGKFVVKVMCRLHHFNRDRSGKKHPLYKEGKFNDRTWLIEKYKTMTLQEIADFCGSSLSLIYRRMIKFNLLRRKEGQRP